MFNTSTTTRTLFLFTAVKNIQTNWYITITDDAAEDITKLLATNKSLH